MLTCTCVNGNTNPHELFSSLLMTSDMVRWFVFCLLSTHPVPTLHNKMAYFKQTRPGGAIAYSTPDVNCWGAVATFSVVEFWHQSFIKKVNISSNDTIYIAYNYEYMYWPILRTTCNKT